MRKRSFSTVAIGSTRLSSPSPAPCVSVPARIAGVIASDIADYSLPLHLQRDFLAEIGMPAGIEAIVTNPPFQLAEDFVAHALELCPRVIMLLRLASLESERRYEILVDRGLARVHVFRKRLPMMHRDQWAGRKANSGMAFAWFVWDRNHTGGPSSIASAGNIQSNRTHHIHHHKEAKMAKSKVSVVKIVEPTTEAAMSIVKPDGFDLDKFKSKRAAAIANVETLPNALPHHTIAQAKDFVRLHHDESNYWSSELCFVAVPIKGSKKDMLHLVEEDLAMQFLPSAKIQRFRLALGSKPNDVFFLCQVPTQNLDNTYNASNLEACEQAKTLWTQATSRREEGVEAYKVLVARDPDAFPAPKWPSQSLSEIIERAFAGRMIDREDHPGLLRLIGARQQS